MSGRGGCKSCSGGSGGSSGYSNQGNNGYNWQGNYGGQGNYGRGGHGHGHQGGCCGGGCGGGCGCPKPCCIDNCYDAGGDCNVSKNPCADSNCTYNYYKLQFGPVKTDCVTITGDGTCNEPLGAIGLRDKLVNPNTAITVSGTGNNVNISMIGGQSNSAVPFNFTQGSLMKLLTTTGYSATAAAEIVVGGGVANPTILGDIIDLIVNPSTITVQALVQLRTITSAVNSYNTTVTASQDAIATPNARIVASTTTNIVLEDATITLAWSLAPGAGSNSTVLRLSLNNPGLIQCKVSCYFTITYTQT